MYMCLKARSQSSGYGPSFFFVADKHSLMLTL